MSDEDKNEEEKKDSPAQKALVDPETRQQNSPELRMLHLLERLTERVETNEEEAKRREERVQGRIEFILQQQAQFSANMQSLREMQENSERRWERTEGSIRSLHAIAQIHEGEITALAERQSEVGERVNALVNTVERLISERRNGGGRGEESSG
jgi:uncharacterized sporulation protein YeaH/YhbH (DUF444 family)